MYYLYGGYRHHVVWNPFYHSYGWFSPNNDWIYYDSVAAPLPVEVAVAPNAVLNPSPPATSVFTQFLNFAFVAVLIGFAAIAVIYVWRAPGPKPTDNPPPAPRKTYMAPDVGPDGGHPGRGRLKKGCVIQLTDPISMEDAHKVDAHATALNVIVDQVLKVREAHDLCSWTLIYGMSEFEDQPLLIKIKEFEGQRSITCYTKDVEGTRQELVESNNCFMFSRPLDESNFVPMELRYAHEFKRNLDGDQEETFRLIHPSELHGSANYLDGTAGQEMLATIAEWRNANRQDNGYIVVETGTGNSSNVEGWWGDSVSPDEIVLPA